MSTSDYQSSFKNRAAGKAQLKEFYKFTHPDFFQSAPAEVKDANSESIQNLNAYLQSVQSLNQQAGKTSLTFFVSKRKLQSDGKKERISAE